jgi:hypothetical protein
VVSHWVLHYTSVKVIEMRLSSPQLSRQVFTLWLGVLLGLAIFISPYQLHHNPGSIFFKISSKVTSNHSSHEHQHHEQSRELHCLRCVLQSFEAPEIIAPLIVIFVLLGFIKLAKPTEPFSFVTLGKSARAPPQALSKFPQK